MLLPEFTYHPDPLATETFIASVGECAVCKQTRGYAYAGPLYPSEDTDDADDTDVVICPWCIANGAAARELQVEFSDACYIGSRHTQGAEVGQDVMVEILQRTPGFITWQDQIWRAHCDDACLYLGRAGGPEIRSMHPQVIEQINEDYCSEDQDIEEYLDDIEKDGSLVALIFQCRHCGQKQCHLEAD
jgi:uncharacterized protein CbrC (UPF0167 family)